MNCSFDSFITDENNVFAVDYLRKLSGPDQPAHAAIILLGPSGVGKTHLCKALAQNKNTIYYTSEDIVSLVKIYLKKSMRVEDLIEFLCGNNMIIDDYDTLVFGSEFTRIDGKLVRTGGTAMSELLWELIRKNLKRGHFVLLSGCWNAPDGPREETIEDGIVFNLDHPSRNARITYCRQRLLQMRVVLPEEEVEKIVDGCRPIMPAIDGRLQTLLARNTFPELE